MICRSLLNSIIIQRFLQAPSAALELQNCTQTSLLLHADVAVIWGIVTDDLSLILQSSRADPAESMGQKSIEITAVIICIM